METENRNLKNEIEKIQGGHYQDITGYKENMSVFANCFKSKTPELIEAPVAERKKPWYKFW